VNVPESDDEAVLQDMGRRIDAATVDWSHVVHLLRSGARRAYCPACLDQHDSLVCPEAAAAEAQG
jgi:hypothetical protein